MIYGPSATKNPTTQQKAPIVHLDLVDSYGQMTITININNRLIDLFLPKLSPDTSIWITNFVFKKKTKYDRGDADYCLQFTYKTTMQTIGKVYRERRLISDTTISELIRSKDSYPIGSVAARLLLLIIKCRCSLNCTSKMETRKTTLLL